MKLRAPVAAATAIAFLVPALAEAHRLDVDSRLLPDGRLRIEVFYSDGRPARKAEVIVRDSNGAQVARGACDAEGVFEFPAPPGMDLEVEALHEGGHRGTHKFRSREAPAERVSREERGRVPYGKLAIGLALIAALATFFGWALRRRHAS